MSSAETSTVVAPATPNSSASPAQTQATVTALSNGSSGAVDSLVCQWASCGERLPTAEQLYDHVCERHVGRKSTNNLNLTCQWGSCRTTTVKRDHITSHIRVHVPLKPHKCDFCGKAFKRPQDLKKHVKTHADDSVLLRSPEPHRGAGNYASSNTKLVADLQSLAATASGYYPDQHHAQPLYYQNASNPSAYHGPGAPQQNSAYGPVYYAVSQPQNLNAEYEMRKKAAFDALNEFFGDAKERRIDPTTYYDVGHRLMALQNIQQPASGFGGFSSSADYTTTAAVAGAPQLLQPQYSLPLPNLRTKNDLLSIDQFLDQLQQTVYENPNHSAAAGVALPGIPTHSGLNYRGSHSPPAMSHVSSSLSPHAMTASTGADTPALTPASSVMSYSSGHSPITHHSVSPIQRPAANSMYPSLPGVSAMAGSTNAMNIGGALTGLGAGFEHDMRRRYSGGQLQKQAPGEAMDTDDDTTPAASPRNDDDLPKIAKLGVSSPPMRNASLDPALRSPGASSSTSSDFADKQQEAWIENVRAIEMLRHFVKERLERCDFIQEGAESEIQKTEEAEASTLYPVLKEKEDGPEAEAETKVGDE